MGKEFPSLDYREAGTHHLAEVTRMSLENFFSFVLWLNAPNKPPRRLGFPSLEILS